MNSHIQSTAALVVVSVFIRLSTASVSSSRSDLLLNLFSPPQDYRFRRANTAFSIPRLGKRSALGSSLLSMQPLEPKSDDDATIKRLMKSSGEQDMDNDEFVYDEGSKSVLAGDKASRGKRPWGVMGPLPNSRQVWGGAKRPWGMMSSLPHSWGGLNEGIKRASQFTVPRLGKRLNSFSVPRLGKRLNSFSVPRLGKRPDEDSFKLDALDEGKDKRMNGFSVPRLGKRLNSFSVPRLGKRESKRLNSFSVPRLGKRENKRLNSFSVPRLGKRESKRLNSFSVPRLGKRNLLSFERLQTGEKRQHGFTIPRLGKRAI